MSLFLCLSGNSLGNIVEKVLPKVRDSKKEKKKGGGGGRGQHRVPKK